MEIKTMARTIKTWISRAKPGRVDDALELFKAAKEYATDAEISLLYADSAGDFSGTFTLVAAFESGAAAGESNDKLIESEDGQRLWRMFNDGDSPVEAVGTATYTSVEL
jgi:hypothetical protein